MVEAQPAPAGRRVRLMDEIARNRRHVIGEGDSLKLVVPNMVSVPFENKSGYVLLPMPSLDLLSAASYAHAVAFDNCKGHIEIISQATR